MKTEDLMTMLDLDGGMKAESADPIEQRQLDAEAKVNDTAIEMDLWARRRGRELAEGDQIISESVGLPEAQKAGDRAYDEALEYWGDAVADFHAAAYEPAPELAEKSKDGLRHEFVKQLMETREFHEMRASTVLNPAAAEVATAAFSKQFAVRRAEAIKDQAQGREGSDSEMLTMQAAAQACASAMSAVSDLTDAAAACGLGEGAKGGKADQARIAKVYKKIRTSPNLQRIAKMAGRFRRLAASKQRQKVTHGADEVVGITLGDEIAKLVPSELAKLADPMFYLETARRLFDRQTLCRETRASEPVGKGPIVVTVDESGSMQGIKHETAKALALALAWIARRQNRWCALVGFSGGCKIEPGAMVLLPPKESKEEELIAWLGHFYGHGTDMDVPLETLPKMWPEFVKQGMARGKTDIVMITDAEVHVPDTLKNFFLKFKAEEKVKLTTLVVQGTPGNINCVSDEVYCLPALDADSEAVGRVLSV